MVGSDAGRGFPILNWEEHGYMGRADVEWIHYGTSGKNRLLGNNTSQVMWEVNGIGSNLGICSFANAEQWWECEEIELILNTIKPQEV